VRGLELFFGAAFSGGKQLEGVLATGPPQFTGKAAPIEAAGRQLVGRNGMWTAEGDAGPKASV
jgi:hypothetical protein